MTKPAQKTAPQPLIHHPSDALDVFGRYDATNRAWLDFDQQISQQLFDFEAKNRVYFTPRSIQREFRKLLGR